MGHHAIAGADGSYICGAFDCTHQTRDVPAQFRRGCPRLFEAGAYSGISLVGVADQTTTFHGVDIEGTNYNAGLINVGNGDLVLIDTVKQLYCDELVANIRAAEGDDAFDRVRYIISLHSEVDHSGSLVYMMGICPNATLYTSNACLTALQKFFPAITRFADRTQIWNATKNTLTVGDYTFTMVAMPLLHWPDNSLAILSSSKAEGDEKDKVVVFSSDGLGSHNPDYDRFFADQWLQRHTREELRQAIIQYHASIVGPYLKMQLRTFIDKKLAPLVPAIKAVVPAHGPAYRTPEDLAFLVGVANELGDSKPVKGKVVILYATMYGGARCVAESIAAELSQRGLKPQLLNVEECGKMALAYHGWNCEAFVVCSSTLNNRVYPSMAFALSYLDGLTFLRGRPCWIGGTYGWAAKEMPRHAQMLIEYGGGVVKNIDHPLMCQWRGNQKELEGVATMADEIVAELAH